MSNPPAYNPEYHAQLAFDAGISAFAAPLGMLEMIAHKYASNLPLILKLNSANSLCQTTQNTHPDQAFTANVKQALHLGCVGVGMTIYPGSERCNAMLEKAREAIAQAHDFGLFSVVWAYPRNNKLDKISESSLDVVAYAAHLACLIGADIVKVKLPNANVNDPEVAKTYETCGFDYANLTLKQRVSHVIQSAFCSSRIVLFSGGSSKNENDLLQEISEIASGGGYGSIIGRNVFQRPLPEAKKILQKIIEIYKNS
jgi:class I fructose-bisphosphate aldolase